ncbi:MAG: DEAD/DEAH box helicase [Candidatus Poseidoniaceae archaeon]|nr:DEAD/DEAH box helicase [Candidatus Poseidoniaceae archaeon]MBL6895654.1 DEAD/DEAH box helicase [Candidatus Poseidoniaceae archaeon]
MPTMIHPLLQDGVEARGYQIRALKNALTSSCLMVMPTGFGKTAVQWMLMAETLRLSDKKIILIAPTTGLVDQQQRMAREMLNIDPETIVRYTGETPPNKRRSLWDIGKILMATSQVIRNDAINEIISLSEVALLIFDEAHHATGNHPYAQVGDLFLNANPDGYTLGATASPGATKSSILEVAKRLGIDRLDISKRNEAMLKPYAVELQNDIVPVDLPETLKTLIYPLQEYQSTEVETLQRMGFMAPVKNLTSKIITDAQQSVSRAISRRDARGYNAARKVSDVRRMHMLLDLLKTQGVIPATLFLDKAEDEGRTGGRGTNRFVAKPVIHNFRKAAEKLGEIHPKVTQVVDMITERLKQNPNSRILIFTEYRYTVQNLNQVLQNIDNVKVAPFIGQATSGKQKGMKQKEQLARLEQFRSGEVNVLVATSVGEEGLDVPSADLVLMYEPVPSAIRAIQRRGRTARQSSGTLKTLIARNTRDEFVNNAAKVRERRMYKNLEEIQRMGRIPLREPASGDVLSSFFVKLGMNEITADKFLAIEQERLNLEYEIIKDESTANSIERPISHEKQNSVAAKDKRPRNQTGLDDFYQETSTENSTREQEITVLKAANEVIQTLSQTIDMNVVLDHREASSTLSAYLTSLGMSVRFENLETGDILLTKDILIERKTSRDLLTSIIDQRLFKQCQRMRQSTNQPILLIELGEIGNSVHPNAVLGALAHVSLDLGVPILTTKDSMESAHLIFLIAKNNQNFSTKMREYVKYQDVDESSIIMHCSNAAKEIAAMVNQGEESHTLLAKWNTDGINKQATILCQITDLELEICLKLFERFDSITDIFKSDQTTLSEILSVDNYELIMPFLYG